MKPKLSVILATKNETYALERCLKSLLNQSLQKPLYEIIVVDYSQNTNTQDIAQKYTNHVYSYIPDYTIINYRGAQINYGVKKSKGHIIFFPDADMSFHTQLLKDIVKKMDNADALFIPEIIKGSEIYGTIRNFERSFYSGTPIDALRVINKKLFTKVNGFEEKKIEFGFDDWDFTKKIKQICPDQRIHTSDYPLYHHEENQTIFSRVKKKLQYSKSKHLYINRWGKNDSDIQKQFSLLYRFITVFISNGRWLRLIKNPLLAFGLFFMKLSEGILFLYYSYERKN